MKSVSTLAAIREAADRNNRNNRPIGPPAHKANAVDVVVRSKLRAEALEPEQEQLYDVAWGPRDDPSKAQFMMRAPARILRYVLKLQKEAYERMLSETKADGGFCLLYPSSRYQDFANSVFVVVKAREPLEAKR